MIFYCGFMDEILFRIPNRKVLYETKVEKGRDGAGGIADARSTFWKLQSGVVDVIQFYRRTQIRKLHSIEKQWKDLNLISASKPPSD